MEDDGGPCRALELSGALTKVVVQVFDAGEPVATADPRFGAEARDQPHRHISTVCTWVETVPKPDVPNATPCVNCVQAGPPVP